MNIEKSGRRPVVANLQYGGKYRGELEEAERTGKCIFCDPGFQRKDIFHLGEWFVVRNSYPTKDREGKDPAFQFLFVSREHRSIGSHKLRRMYCAGAFLVRI